MVQKKVFISREKNRRLLWKNGDYGKTDACVCEV